MTKTEGKTARFCSQMETSGVAQMRKKQIDRPEHRFREAMFRSSATIKDIPVSNPDGLREVIGAVMQEVLEAEMDESLGAQKG